MNKPLSKRATFEDVIIAQEQLRHLIDKLIIENGLLTNEKERDNFFNLFAKCTLGLGVEQNFLINSKNKTHNIGNMEHAARWLAYQESTPIKLDEDVIDISIFWKKLRDQCFIVFPYAIKMSINISKEQTHLGPSESGRV